MRKVKKIIRRLILLLIVFGLFFACYYTYAISPSAYQFQETSFISNQISSQLNGFKIAYLSDINLTDQKSLERLQKIIKELNTYPFDMVIFGGDLYDEQVFETKEVANALKDIQCKYGKFAVLGERDENNDLEVTQVLNNGGFEVLNNESRSIYYKETTTSFQLIAYNDDYDFSQIKNDDQTLNIGIAHQPDTFTKAKEKIDLQLSGHSYGGSIYLPYFGALLPIDGAKTYNHGTYEEEQSTLIVSNGISGPSSFPYKLLCPNEISMIVLTTKSSETSS